MVGGTRTTCCQVNRQLDACLEGLETSDWVSEAEKARWKRKQEGWKEGITSERLTD